LVQLDFSAKSQEEIYAAIIEKLIYYPPHISATFKKEINKLKVYRVGFQAGIEKGLLVQNNRRLCCH
jgi:hypothetical protein